MISYSLQNLVKIIFFNLRRSFLATTVIKCRKNETWLFMGYRPASEMKDSAGSLLRKLEHALHHT